MATARPVTGQVAKPVDIYDRVRNLKRGWSAFPTQLKVLANDVQLRGYRVG
jgi:hypothetical protein